jgi:hypothetical protein
MSLFASGCGASRPQWWPNSATRRGGLRSDDAEVEISEPRFDWPTGPLEWFEVARLGLREPRQ